MWPIVAIRLSKHIRISTTPNKVTGLKHHPALCFQVETPTESLFGIQCECVETNLKRAGGIWVLFVKTEVMKKWHRAKLMAVQAE